MQTKKLIAALKLPTILNIPPKLFPLIFDFNKYSLFLIEGGRGSAKTHSVGRFILYDKMIKDALKAMRLII